MNGMNGGAGSVEITIKGNEGELQPSKHSCNIYRGIYTVGFGDKIIETTYSDVDVTISNWIREVHRLHRLRNRKSSNKAPLIAGISTYHQKEYWHPSPKAGANKNNLPIILISLCVGGSHCLVATTYGFSHPLRSFLSDQTVVFVGIGIKNVAEALERDLGLQLSSPTELRPLVERAFGKETESDLKGLEEMAHVALGGIHVGKKPPKFESINGWNRYDPGEDELMYATVDSYLACEIGARCFERINA